MKHTIKTAGGSVVVLPVGGSVHVEVSMPGTVLLDVGHVGALLFALEQAGEEAERARMLGRAMEMATPRAAA